MTNEVLGIRDEISELWHDNLATWHARRHFGFDTADRFVAFCAAKDWLQDTSESLLVHRERGFSDNPHLAYIEFWGVLQAAVVQQDAIKELHYAVTNEGQLPAGAVRPAWKELRELRNLAVGHPTKRRDGTRSVSGREGKTYERIPLQVWQKDGTGRFDFLRLGELLDRYDAEAAHVMRTELLPKFKALLASP